MDRAPAQDKDSQKRRKKSQETSGTYPETMDDDEVELFHIVQEDLRLKSTVGWQNAVKVLNSAYQHLERSESQGFLDDAFSKIISIMLDQHASKIGSFEKSCVIQCLSLAIPLVVAQLKAGKYFQALPVLTMLFNKKKMFYKETRTSAMIGSYWNKVPGSPEVRAQCIEAFCELKGFHLLLSTLELLMQNQQEGDDLEAAIDSEDIRILLQALLEFRTSVPESICTNISVLVMTYFTKISDTVLKKESSDAVGAVIGIIRRLVDAGILSSEAINALWLDITERYVESTSLPLRLFGLEQINLIVNCARASRAFPPRYFIRNAGTAAINGVYILKANSNSATYVFRQPETGQVFTLFCCTMKSGLKWWFISEADKMQPGSDQDIDYYQHQSQYEEYLPPTHNWIPTGKGEAPAPELVAETVQENGEEDLTRLDNILSAWVVKKKILEEIFGDRIHREIVSRSALLVKFLAESNKLDTHSIDVIWQSCIQKDQTLVHEIHNLLITTVPFLSNELLLHLVRSIHASLLRSLEKNEPFPELISFLQRLATNSPSFLMERNVNVTTAILQLLWSIQMHCSIASIRLSRSLRDFFQEGLRSEYGEPLRKAFLNECINGIKKSCSLSNSAPDSIVSPPSTMIPPAPGSSSSVMTSSSVTSTELSSKDSTASKSLELLKFLIDSYRMDQAFVVESLNLEHGLVSLLFDELATFVARRTDKQSPSYRTAIGHRLELIHYVHVKSPKLELSVPQIERLWKVLSSSPAEREFCLIFFNQTSIRGGHQQGGTSTVGGSISSAFNLDVCFYVFNELLCKQTDFRTLGSMGYKCFDTYFVGLNAQQKLMQRTEVCLETKTLNLLGMDALWRIAFEAPLEVAEMATRELLRVYERSSAELSPESEGESDEGVKDFLSRVFKQLSTVKDSSPDSLKLVQQCSNLLTGLVSSSRKKHTFVPHGLSGRGAYFTVKVIAQRIPSSNTTGIGASATAASSHDNAVRTMQASAYSNQTLWLFRKQIEKLVNHPMQQTKILSSGSAITGDQKTLADLQITESSEVRVLMFNSIVHRSSLSVMDQDPLMISTGKGSPSSCVASSSKHHPGLVIASDTSYFEVLFRVLDIVEGHPVHELLWAFLKQIPTSEELLNRVSNIGTAATSDGDVNMSFPSDQPANEGTKPDWSSLVKGISSHQAIYTLQIMDALLLPSDVAKIPFAQTYLQRFISGGGFHEVLSYFIGANFHESSFNEGAAVALRILKFCLFDSGHDNGLYSATANGEPPDDVLYGKGSVTADHDKGVDAETPRTKIVVEQSRYDQLVLKIAELVGSEYARVEEKAPADKTAYRIFIDAVKTVESIVSIAHDAAAKYIKALEPRAIVANIFMKFESDQVREQWLSSLESVCKASDAAAEVVFEECIQSVDRIESVTAPCDQYTRMICALARLEGGNSSSYCQKLAQAVVAKLRRGFSSKFLACNERSGEVLIGFLEFLREVLVVHADVRAEIACEIVDVVYDECLFTLPSEDRRGCPLCLSLETRRPAFKLLASAISSDASILHDLRGRLIRLFTRSDALRFKWGQENNIETRGNGEHVGLKNQGCSCYMNSFLQQLFMHPTLRQGLLGAKVDLRPTPQEPTKAEAETFPERLVGCRVALECLGGRVYEANVVGYDEMSGQHTMRYENGGEASFVLAEGRPGNENGRYVILQPELTGTDATLEVLRQLQRTFCYLRDSEMRYFNPKAFVDSCTCLNLEFSVYQQNDATEFCDKLLDRLETGLKTTPQGTRCLQDVLGGKLISQKLPKDCGHRYEREEPFIRLELQIRGKESIEESLSAFVEGELMDGDNKVECELCATKKAAVRRTCFGSLPNLLILHLKRFDLDYTTFETVKLNNRCSFPMRLSMKPYTKAGIEEQEARSNLQQEREETSTDEDMASDDSSSSDEFITDVNSDASVVPASASPKSSVKLAASPRSTTGETSVGDDERRSVKSDPNYEYRLKGVLVHSGVAQGGHYYSFIYDHMSEKWFKYDDEDVTPFDPANIEAECFGGVQRRSWHGSNNSMEMEVFSNALMLYYEKVIPVKPAPVLVTKTETESGAPTDIVVAAPDEEHCEYEAEVWKSNEVFLQNSYLFDVEFHEFLREMVQSQYIKATQVPATEENVLMTLPPAPQSCDGVVPPAALVAPTVPSVRADDEIQMTLMEIGAEFVLSVLLHSREKHGIARWITVLASKFTRSKTICVRFFSALSASKRVSWLRGLLFECPDSIARQSFVHLVSRALTAYEAHMKEEQAALDEASAEAAAAADTAVIRAFVEAISSFLDQTSVMQQSHLEECFLLIRNIAEISVTARTQLQQVEMIARLINFFLCERGPSALKDAFPSSKLQPTASRYASPDYQYLLEAVIAVLGLPRRMTEPLLTESSTQYPHRTILSEKAEHALTEIFEDYQKPGGADGNPGLGLEELKKYFSVSLSSAVNSPAVEQQARSMLAKYGTPTDVTAKDDVGVSASRVELDEFMLFYTDVAASSTKSVLQDLRAFGFSEDLRRHSSSEDLPTGTQVLESLSALSRGALLNDVFFDSALEEEAESTSELLLRLSLGDKDTSKRLLRALLHCLQSTESGWKGQPVVDACALAVQRVLGYECAYQRELVELALAHSEYGLLSSARSRENSRSRYANTTHVPLFVYRQLVLVLELRARVPAVSAWLDEHRSEWEWLYEWLRLESLQPTLGGRLPSLRRELAKQEMLWRLSEALSIPYQEEQRRYVVEGAGYAPVNGVYVSTSHIHDNCLTYVCAKSDIEYTLFRCCMPSKARRWYISYSPNKNLLGTMSDEDFYFVQSHIDDESPPVDGWKVWVKNEKAKPPVPTVRLYSSTVAALDGEGDAADASDSVDGYMAARCGFPQHEEGPSAPIAPSSDMIVETVDVDADVETVEYDDSEDEIRDSNERFRAVHLDTQEDGSGTDDFM
ncbi:hypothetical protein KXD40_002914 [Peronospora effusa]|nr:hypothetical protein KXD40_002914 [Peronospora effusa]